MLKIKEKQILEDGNVELTITTDHTGEEQDFIVRISREILARMTLNELKVELKTRYKELYEAYLDGLVDDLVDPLIGVDFSEE